MRPTQGLYLHTGQHNTEKRGHIHMPRTVVEPTKPVFERPKAVRASESSAIGTGSKCFICSEITSDFLSVVKTDLMEIPLRWEMGLTYSGQGHMAGFFVHGHEPLHSIKTGNVLFS
jgi:hypothetical protein